MNSNRSNKNFFFCVLFLCMVVLLTGCNKNESGSNGDDNGDLIIEGKVIGTWSGKGDKEIEFEIQGEKFNYLWKQFNDGKLEIQAVNINGSVLSGSASSSPKSGIVEVYPQMKGKHRVIISADKSTEWEVTVFE